MRKAAPIFFGLALFFVFVPTAQAVTCTNGMVETPADVRTLIPALPECVFPRDLTLFQSQNFHAAAEAMKRLGENLCPGFQLGYANVPMSVLKENYVYFMYPSADGQTVTMSAEALTCFDKALTAMKAANLNVCISAALRSPDHQNASCRDTVANPPGTAVCGRTNNCSGSYAGCPHVTGRAMDFDDKATCTGSGPTKGCSISWDFANRMRQAAATAGAYPDRTAMNDRPHLVCGGAPASVPNGGLPSQQGPPVGNNGITPQQMGGLPGLMQGLSNLFAPPPVPQCQAGFILMNGQCLPQQAQNTNQVNSPYSYMPPPSPSTATGSPSTNGNSNTGSGVDIGSGVNISGLINSDGEKKTGTSTSAIDLINAIAGGGKEATSVPIGKSVGLNDSLENKSELQGTLASSSATLSPTSTYKLNPTPTQTFVSEDLSKTPTQPFTNPYNSTFGVLENLRQILISILSLLRPFGGVTPSGTIHPAANSATAVLR